MAKIELKGYLLLVNRPETIGEKNTPKQVIILKVPAYRDEFGDAKGQDEEWPLDLIGDNVAKFDLGKEDEGKKAKCTVYLNGQKFIKKADSTEGWIINARLGAIELIGAAGDTTQNTQTANPPAATASKKW